MPPPAADTHGGGHVTDYSFSFEGPFGRFDQAQLQRGLQVYTEVCSACHGLKFLPYRELAEHGGPAMTEEQMRAYAAMHDVTDAETGEDRPATPSDHFQHSPDPNAPDLTLMAKARAGFHGPVGLGFNQLFRGIGGPGVHRQPAPRLHRRGARARRASPSTRTPSSPAAGFRCRRRSATSSSPTPTAPRRRVEQMAQDVAAFLMWAAEPKMMARKSAGLTAVLFLIGLTVLLYFTNKKIWAPHKGSGKHA